MSDRSTSWSVTINNPTASDEEQIALARQKGWKVEGQLEQGANGTPHYQLAVKTPQVRFSAMKKAFPRAHIEVARNAPALQTYVNKEETRIGVLPTSSEMYPSLTKFWELLSDTILPIGDYLYADKKHRRLIQYDEAVRKLIEKGYHVESLAMNPSTRSIWNTYADSIMKRTETERQTAKRQAEIISQSVTIPTQDADEISEGSQGEEDDASSCSSGTSFSSGEYK